MAGAGERDTIGNAEMNNRELAEALALIANLLEIKGEVIYTILAYRKASESLLSLAGDVNQFWKDEKLREIPGVGKSIAEKIDELLRTGSLKYLEQLEKDVPAGLAEWLQVSGLGPNDPAISRQQRDGQPQGHGFDCPPDRRAAGRSYGHAALGQRRGDQLDVR